MLLETSELYALLILPLLIFVARVADVSMGTIRVIFISRGMKYMAPVVGFFEILIWLMAIGQIMQNLSSPLCYLAYAGGFAMGNFVGIAIAEKLSLGSVILRVISGKNTDKLIEDMKTCGYGVTIVDGQGASGAVKIIFTIARKTRLKNLIKIVNEFDPNAFYSVEEVNYSEQGIFAANPTGPFRGVLNFLRPFRKSK